MDFILLFLTYLIAGAVSNRLLKQYSFYDRIYCFLIIFLTSGLVYLSATFLLVYLIIDSFIKAKPNLNQIIKIIFFTSLISIVNLFNTINNLNYSEYLQLITFVCLIITLNNRSYKRVKVISLGFLIGSIIIAINTLINNYYYSSLSQSNFSYFSISGTYNYTIYYLFFGLIIAPNFIINKISYRIIFFLLFSNLALLLQSRSGLLLGFIFFSFLNLNFKSFFRFISLISTVLIGAYLFVNSSFVDKNNQNDIVYSIINFETNTSNLERAEMFFNSFEILENNPLGAGSGNANFFLKRISISHPHAHNTLANWIYELGYLGVILYICLLYFIITPIIFRRNLKPNKASIAIILYIFIMSQLSSLQFNVLQALITYLGVSMVFNNSITEIHD